MLMHDLKAQETFKRAGEIAVAGNHGLFLFPLDGAPHCFDPAAMADRPQLREIWERHERQPWRIEAAEEEISVCNDALRKLESDAGNLDVPRSGLLRISIQPLPWIDRLLPPPAEPHAAILARIEKARARLPNVSAELTDASALALLKGWQGYFSDNDPQPFIHVARTIAAIDGARDIGRNHLAEAFSYRGE